MRETETEMQVRRRERKSVLRGPKMEMAGAVPEGQDRGRERSKEGVIKIIRGRKRVQRKAETCTPTETGEEEEGDPLGVSDQAAVSN